MTDTYREFKTTVGGREVTVETGEYAEQDQERVLRTISLRRDRGHGQRRDGGKSRATEWIISPWA